MEAVIAEYRSGAAVDRERLAWHQQRWADYWTQRGEHDHRR